MGGEFGLSARSVEYALPQQIELAATIHRTLHELELVHPPLGLSLAVGQGHRGHHRLSVLHQLDGEGLQFGDAGRFGPLRPLLQP